MTISRIRARPRLWQGLLALGVLLASACGSDGGGGDAGGPALRLSAAFDIDGTLTSDPGDFFGPPRPDAVRTVELLLDKGYDVFLVTARPPLLEDFTRNWLRDQGFPEVPLFLAPDLAATLAPTDYKRDTLLGLEAAEMRDFVLGYGDSTTDFDAWEQAGIPTDRVFALRRGGASDCEPGAYAACLDGYTEHLPFLNALPDAPGA